MVYVHQPRSLAEPVRGSLTASGGTPTEIDMLSAERVKLRVLAPFKYTFAASSAAAIAAFSAGTAVWHEPAGVGYINRLTRNGTLGRYLYIEAESGGAVSNGLIYQLEG